MRWSWLPLRARSAIICSVWRAPADPSDIVRLAAMYGDELAEEFSGPLGALPKVNPFCGQVVEPGRGKREGGCNGL